MKSYFATYISSFGAAPLESTLLVFDKNLNIGFRNPDGSNVMVNWMLKDVEASYNFSKQETKLKHTKTPGAELLIQGGDAAAFVKDRQAELQKVWYRKSSGKEWIRNSLLFLAVLGVLFLLYLLIVPWLSQKLASKVSVKTEKQIGDAVYDALGIAAQEDHEKSFLLNEFFKEMDVPTAYEIKISVINESTVNAFALPGGRIVIYSALLKEISSYPELAALLSHEFTHINNRHSTKSIFRRLGSKVFLGLLFGRFGTVTSVVVDHADNLKSLKYSRSLEKEADLGGLKILIERGIDPRGFADLLNHMKESGKGTVLPEFLLSHPDINKRIAYIGEGLSGETVKEDEELKSIFEKIKS